MHNSSASTVFGASELPLALVKHWTVSRRLPTLQVYVTTVTIRQWFWTTKCQGTAKALAELNSCNPRHWSMMLEYNIFTSWLESLQYNPRSPCCLHRILNIEYMLCWLLGGPSNRRILRFNFQIACFQIESPKMSNRIKSKSPGCKSNLLCSKLNRKRPKIAIQIESRFGFAHHWCYGN